MTLREFLDSIIFSYSQIFFSNRRWFGILAFASTMIVPEIGILALMGTVISNLIALLLKFDKAKIKDGFYGFNPMLLGAAAGFYFEMNPHIILLILLFYVITYFISAVLEHHLAQVFNLPSLSLPFVISIYIFIIFLTNVDYIEYKQLTFLDYDYFIYLPEFVLRFMKSYSLVLFQSSPISGLILILIVLFYSRVMFVNSIIAFIFNFALLNLILPDPTEDVILITSLNAILTSFALGGSLIIISRKSIPLILISISIVIIFTGFFSKILQYYYLPVLVLPFNFVVLSIIYGLKFRSEHSDLVLLYFQPGSPEENYYYHKNRESRFSKFKYRFFELPFFGEWYISQAHDGEITHKDEWKYAWDFVIHDEKGKEFANKGDSKEDYYCFGTPVVSPLDGKVAKVFDDVADNKIGDTNLKYNWGNTVIIEHDENLYSSLSHLKYDSIKVKEGDEIKKGEIIAACGNSGRSPYPHLHFQFQATDKLGDKTISFPFSNYLQKNNGKFKVETFDIPAEGSYVKNIELHKTLKKAFDLKLGDKFKFKVKLGDKEWIEEWEIKTDTSNNMYIESSRKGKAYLYLSEKVFYLTNFIGGRNSALYYFYLLAVRVPLGYNDNMQWSDSYPLSIVSKNLTRYLSELFLSIYEFIRTEAELIFPERKEKSKEFTILSKLRIKGSGIFSFYELSADGKLVIDESGEFSYMSYKDEKLEFSAVNILKTESKNED